MIIYGWTFFVDNDDLGLRIYNKSNIIHFIGEKHEMITFFDQL